MPTAPKVQSLDEENSTFEMNTNKDDRKPQHPPSGPTASSEALAINYKWNPDDPRCVRCGAEMFLIEGCEWADDPAENLCHQCALGAVNDLRRLVVYLKQQNSEVSSGSKSKDI